jgi:hypothetical protein
LPPHEPIRGGLLRGVGQGMSHPPLSPAPGLPTTSRACVVPSALLPSRRRRLPLLIHILRRVEGNAHLIAAIGGRMQTDPPPRAGTVSFGASAESQSWCLFHTACFYPPVKIARRAPRRTCGGRRPVWALLAPTLACRSVVRGACSPSPSGHDPYPPPPVHDASAFFPSRLALELLPCMDCRELAQH